MSRLIRMLIPLIALIFAQLACIGPGCPMNSFVIAGRIIDGEGKAISKALVTLKSNGSVESSPAVTSGSSNELGKFESEWIFGSICSSYHISVSADGYETYQATYVPPALQTGTPYEFMITLNKAND